MDAREQFNGFNHALRVADQVTVGVLNPKTAGKPAEQPCEVENFPVRAAHCGQHIPVAQKLGEVRIDAALVFPFVRDDVPRDERVGFVDQRQRAGRCCIVESVRDLTQPIQRRAEVMMSLP